MEYHESNQNKKPKSKPGGRTRKPSKKYTEGQEQELLPLPRKETADWIWLLRARVGEV